MIFFKKKNKRIVLNIKKYSRFGYTSILSQKEFKRISIGITVEVHNVQNNRSNGFFVAFRDKSKKYVTKIYYLEHQKDNVFKIYRSMP